jgi:hypothetical protein
MSTSVARKRVPVRIGIRDVLLILLPMACGVSLALLWAWRQAPSSAAPQPGDLTRPHPTAPQHAASVPRFSPTSSGDLPELVPGRPGYDPARLIGIIRAREIFDQEPRDERWASAVEERLNHSVQAEVAQLVPDLGKIHIECRTSTCKYTWENAEGSVPTGAGSYDTRVSEVLHLLYGGVGGGSQASMPEFYAIYAGQDLAAIPRDDMNTLFRGIEERRRRRLHTARVHFQQTGISLLPAGVDMSKLPTQ